MMRKLTIVAVAVGLLAAAVILMPTETVANGNCVAVIDFGGQYYLTEPGGTDSSDNTPTEDESVILDSLPEIVFAKEPEYPRLACQAGIEGKVYIKALVDTRGKTADAKVYKSSGHEMLDEAALKAARYYEYRPGYRDGKPVATWVTFKIEFNLDE